MSYKEYQMGIIDKSEWAYECRDDDPYMGEPTERCENCMYYRPVGDEEELTCVCFESQYHGEPMDEYDYCNEWEKKK